MSQRASQSPYHPLAIHSAFLAAMLASKKFNLDNCYDNTYYALVGGITLLEDPKTADKERMNKLELDFLFGVDFNLFVTGEEYSEYRLGLFPPVEQDKSNTPVDQNSSSPDLSSTHN